MAKKKNLAELQRQLGKLTADWEEDGSLPPNYVRKTGTGEVVAEVNVWCGGFQDPHDPVTVGWRAKHGNTFLRGVELVSRFHSKESAIKQAKFEADEALSELRRPLLKQSRKKQRKQNPVLVAAEIKKFAESDTSQYIDIERDVLRRWADGLLGDE